MNYRHYITIGSSRTEVFPLNFLSSDLVFELETDQIFKRKKFEGSLTFVNINGGADFDLLYLNETTDPCGKIIYEIELSGVNYFTGFFSTSDGDFDLDRCTFEVTPQTDDKYTDILEDQETEYNLLNNIALPSITVNVPYSTVVYTRNRLLYTVIGYLASQLVPGCTISSTFFTAANNPATLISNHLLHLTIAQKSDIIRPTSTDPATVMNISWKSLMDILWAMFQVRWDYDLTTNVFNIEHISFWTRANGLDLRTQEIAKAGNKYSYLKSEMPQMEKFYFAEAYNTDFVGSPISYFSKCVNQDPVTNKKETTINVTTDIEYIISDPSEIKDDGFVILCNYLSGSDYYIELGVGKLSGNLVLNANLSWANLHNSYYRHNRVLIEGHMNGVNTTFWTAQKNILQPCNAIICPSDNFDPDDLITTELGETYLSAKASVRKAVLKPTGEAALELIYGPDDNVMVPEVENGVIIINQTCDIWCDKLTATLSKAMDINRDIIVTYTQYAYTVDYEGVKTEYILCQSDPETWTITAGSVTSNFTLADRCVGDHAPSSIRIELDVTGLGTIWTHRYYPCDSCVDYH